MSSLHLAATAGLALVLTSAVPASAQQPPPAPPSEAPPAQGQPQQQPKEGQPQAPQAEQPSEKKAPPPPAAAAPEAEAPEQPAPLPKLPEAPPAQAGEETGGEISLEDWSRDDWMLVQPKIALLELNGYFRLRGDMFRKLAFANRTATEVRDAAPDDPGFNLSTAEAGKLQRYPVTDNGNANYTTANMRLRIEPTINVTDNIHIITTVDVFDNLVLGSTPRIDVTQETATPIGVLSRGQEPPSDALNAITDSIVVKRAYVSLTALNEQLQLMAGRMPSNWGLGMLSNDGDCLDCDYGDVVDRIALGFKLADHIFMPMYDWPFSGPVLLPYGRSGGQPIDAAPWDDVEQYSLRVMRLDSPDDIKERVKEGERVLNYGAWLIWRRQFRGFTDAFYQANPPPTALDPSQAPVDIAGQDERRDANIYTGDAYGKLYVGELELGAELCTLFGSFKNPGALGSTTTDLFQYGGALEGSWRLRGDYKGTVLKLKAGAASGDSANGFGALNASGTQSGLFVNPDGSSRVDKNLRNFQFSPDYHVDLLLFRRIIGTVTDAWYVRPDVSYTFANNISGDLGVIYSQAFKKRSTPGTSRPLGLEVDAELAYSSEPTPQGGALKGSLAGGMLFPFAAFKNRAENKGEQDPSFAWTLQARMYVTY